MTYITIYLLIGVLITTINYEKMQEICLKYLNDEIDSDPYLYASIRREVLDILERYLFLIYIIIWPKYIIKMLCGKEDTDTKDTNK
jgi:hypothetical protein